MLEEAPTAPLADVEAFALAQRLGRGAATHEPRLIPSIPAPPVFDLTDGTLLAGRYRVLCLNNFGWVGYDERLTRPVVVELLTGPGTPAERIRREAAMDERLSDALVVGGEAFAIRTTTML